MTGKGDQAENKRPVFQHLGLGWKGAETETGSTFFKYLGGREQKARPKTGATSANTYDVGDLPILVIAGKLALRLW